MNVYSGIRERLLMTQSGRSLLSIIHVPRPIDSEQCMEGSTRISIEYSGGSSGTADVVFVGPTEAIMDGDPMSCFFADSEGDLKHLPDFRDLVELKKISRDKYQFVRVLKRAKFKRFQYLLSEPERQSSTLEPVLTKVIELGGDWERVFGGVLTIFLPKDCEYDPENDVRSLLGSPRAN